MKLIITIIHERDKQKVSDSLLQAGHKFTVVASTGGFLRDGNTTMLIGAEDELVEDVLDVVRKCCSSRDQFVAQLPPDATGAAGVSMAPVEVTVGGAIIFVVDVEKFERV